MKYKVGDKVKIKSLDWHNQTKDKDGNAGTDHCFVRAMSEYCGKTAKIINDSNDRYRLDIDEGFFVWSDEMFEDEPIEVAPLEEAPETIHIDSASTDKLVENNNSDFDSVCCELSALHLRKNKDYGNAFSDMYKRFGITYPIIHLEEKLKRIESLQSASNEVKGETYVDSLKDLASYAIMTLMEIENEKAR